MTDHVGLVRSGELPFVSFFKHSPIYGYIDNPNCDLEIASLQMGADLLVDKLFDVLCQASTQPTEDKHTRLIC